MSIRCVIVFFSLWTDASAQQVFSLKWAMDDLRYAEQHSAPYSNDLYTRQIQMFQESIDARFQQGTYGVYVGGGGAASHTEGGQGEVSFFTMPTAWSTLRYGIIAMEYNGQGAAGGTMGLRFHAPTRLTPYAGVAGVLALESFGHGYSTTNSKGQQVPRYRTIYPTGLAAFVPELGVSYWINSRTRLNVGGSWYLVSGHRQPDFFMIGASVEFASRGENVTTPPTEVVPSRDDEREQYFYPSPKSSVDPRPEVDPAPNLEVPLAPQPQTQFRLAPAGSLWVIDETLIVPRLNFPKIFIEEATSQQEPNADARFNRGDWAMNSTQTGGVQAKFVSTDSEDMWLHEAMAARLPGS